MAARRRRSPASGGHADVAGELDAIPGVDGSDQVAQPLEAKGRVEPAPAGQGARVDGGAGRRGAWPGRAGPPRRCGRRRTARTGPGRGQRRRRRRAAGRRRAPDQGAAPGRPGEHEVLAEPGHALDQQAAAGVGERRARPPGADALLGEHGDQVRARRVLGGQQGERVAPARAGSGTGPDRLRRAGAEPPLAAAGGPAEGERGDPAAHDGGGRDREAEQVGDQEAEGLVAEQAAEPVRPAEPGGKGDRSTRSRFPEDGVGLADPARPGVDAELDPLAGAAVEARG